MPARIPREIFITGGTPPVALPAHVQVRQGEGAKAYDDLPVVRELRGLANRARVAGKVASRSSDETKKWLSWPDFLKVVQQLRCECAGALACSRAALEHRWQRPRFSALASASDMCQIR